MMQSLKRLTCSSATVTCLVAACVWSAGCGRTGPLSATGLGNTEPDAGGQSGSSGSGGFGGAAGGGGSAGVLECDTRPGVYAEPLGICNDDGWCWENPIPNANRTLAISGNETDAWAAQYNELLHWDGTTWERAEGPTGTALWSSVSNEVWLLDPAGTSLHHFDGSTWSTSPMGAPFTAIHGSSPTNVWILGKGVAARWNGSIWENMPAPPSGIRVWAISPSDVWAVGDHTKQGAVHRFDGGEWVQQPVALDVADVWASGADDIWLVGTTGGGLGGIVRWNGLTFVDVELPKGVSGLRSVRGRSANDVWFGGSGTPPNPAVLHWNGAEFSAFSLEVTSGVDGFWLPPGGASRLIAGEGGGGSFLATFDGTAWRAPGIGCIGYFSDIWGSGWDDVWAVGGRCLAHFDGTRWTASVLPEVVNITGIWGTSRENVWSVDTLGKIRHWNGADWSIAGQVSSALVDVWGSAPAELWMIDQSGGVIRWRETATENLIPPVSEARAIWASGPTDVWVVGAGATRFNGTSWSSVELAGHGPFTAVWGRSANDVWVGGEKLHRWDGANWTEHAPGIALRSIWGCGSEALWIAGAFEAAALEPNGEFTLFDLPVSTSPLHAIWASSARNIVVAGYGGALLRRTK